MISWYDAAGLLAIVCSTGAYIRLQWRRDFAKTFAYSGLNLASSALFAVLLLHNWNLAAFINNGIWCVFSLYGLYRCSKYLWRARGAKIG